MHQPGRRDKPTSAKVDVYLNILKMLVGEALSESVPIGIDQHCDWDTRTWSTPLQFQIGQAYLSFSLIRTVTVGSGLSPDLLTSTNRRSWAHPIGYTTGGEFHPALRIICFDYLQ